MSIDTYKLTSTEEPTDEVLSQLMREAAEEAAQKRAEATAQTETDIPCTSAGAGDVVCGCGRKGAICRRNSWGQTP